MTNNRFIFLDGMRGIAALAVVITHVTHFSYFGSGALAVDMFFCLSGFVIAYAYQSKIFSKLTIREYFVKRLNRLYPMFLIGLFLGLVALLLKVYHGQSDYTYTNVFTALLLNTFYLPYLNQGTFLVFSHLAVGNIFPVNNPSWSLFFELIANILFVFTIKLSKPILIGIAAILGVWLAIYAVLSGSAPGGSTSNFIGGFPRVGYTFLIGVILYRCFQVENNGFKVNYLVVAVPLALMMLVPQWSSHWFYYWAFAAILIVPILVWLGIHVQIRDTRIAAFFEYIGWLSYPVYCVHVPILNLVSTFNPNPVHLYRFGAVIVIGIVIISHILGKYLDEPIRAKLAKKP